MLIFVQSISVSTGNNLRTFETISSYREKLKRTAELSFATGEENIPLYTNPNSQWKSKSSRSRNVTRGSSGVLAVNCGFLTKQRPVDADVST